MIISREHIIHSANPYVRKCCGFIHLRVGSSISCLIWAGLSLYFAILSFQAKSPFYSYTDAPTALYIFGTINLILFGICLGTLLSLYLRSGNGVKAASFIINIVLFVLVVDMIANTILFIVQRSGYVQWCIQSTSIPLTQSLSQGQSFDFNSRDFFNCNRAWEDELKFVVLCTLLIIILYMYWAFCLFSYAVKLRVNIKAAMVQYYQQGMMPQAPMVMPTMNNGDIIL